MLSGPADSPAGLLTLAALAAVLAAAVRGLRRKKPAGGARGGNCAGCPMSGSCPAEPGTPEKRP